jgi:predicted enzyme related to lactoylglutathione lyase
MKTFAKAPRAAATLLISLACAAVVAGGWIVGHPSTTAANHAQQSSGSMALPTAPPGCSATLAPGEAPVDRTAALGKVEGAVNGQGGHVSKAAVKLMTYSQYAAIMDPNVQFVGVVRPGQPVSTSPQVQSPSASEAAGMIVHADDPVFVVAFGGTWYPEGDRGGSGASPAGVVVVSAKTGQVVEWKWYAPGYDWPTNFSALPDYTSLPCVPID